MDEVLTDQIMRKPAWYFNWYKCLPKWIRIIVEILLVLTMVYFIMILLYKIWDTIGKIIHFLSDRRNWWTYSIAVLIVVVGGLIVAQMIGEWKPFTELIEWAKGCFQQLIGLF